jgi:hypothetical protein
MTLKKGFLGRRFTYKDFNLSRYEACLYASIWFSASLVTFLVIISIKEAFRFFTYNSVVDEMVLLSKHETIFFNFFYARLTCFFSFSLVASHVLQRPSALRNIKTYAKRTICESFF